MKSGSIRTWRWDNGAAEKTRDGPSPPFRILGTCGAAAPGANRWLLLLDFDGTLVPLIDNPNGVRLDAAVRRVLRGLARQPGLSVYVMSGRRLADLRRRVRVAGVHLLGLHGWESHGAALPPSQKQILHEAKIWLALEPARPARHHD